MSASSEKQSFDAARRRLCPDGACIGLLDDSGRCKECGLVAGESRPAAPVMAAPEVDEPESEETAPVLQGEDAFDPARRLCPDGDCLGVLGPDGRCRVCGRVPEE
jgi:hypothetical protein